MITGGSSLLPGAVELAEQMFEMPVRRGIPSGLSGLMENVRDPRHATGVGLLIYGSRREGARGTAVGGGSSVSGLWGRVSTWFKGEF